MKTDVGSVDACNACAAAAAGRFSGIDYLVNNTGLLSVAFHRPLVQIEADTYLQLFNVMAHTRSPRARWRPRAWRRS